MKTKEYRRPVSKHIERRDAPALYALEEKRDEIMQEIGDRLKPLHGISDQFKEAMPQAVFDLMESFEAGVGITASVAFLEKHGYKVTEPEK